VKKGIKDTLGMQYRLSLDWNLRGVRQGSEGFKKGVRATLSMQYRLPLA